MITGCSGIGGGGGGNCISSSSHSGISISLAISYCVGCKANNSNKNSCVDKFPRSSQLASEVSDEQQVALAEDEHDKHLDNKWLVHEIHNHWLKRRWQKFMLLAKEEWLQYSRNRDRLSARWLGSCERLRSRHECANGISPTIPSFYFYFYF